MHARLLLLVIAIMAVPAAPAGAEPVVPAAVAEVPGWPAGLAPAGESAAYYSPPASPSDTLVGGRAASIDCIAQAIGYEAGSESELGQEAVAQVILNRLRHRSFPKTVCSVVYQGSARRTGCQFTFACDGSLHRALSRRTWDRALRIAAEAVDGGLPPTIGDATHYHADYVSPRWAPAMVRLGSVGAHIFYRFPGAGGLLGDAGAFDTASAGAPGRPRSRRPQPAVFSVWGLTAATVSGTRIMGGGTGN